MSAQLIDGKLIATRILSEVRQRVELLRSKGVTPGLAAVLVGDDPASATYVASKAKACEKLGIYSRIIRKDASLSQTKLLSIVQELNDDPAIHGILVQSPLPKAIDELAVTLAIRPEKDVDGFHPHNVGMMLIGRPTLLPCTPFGIIKLLEYSNIDPAGKEVVVVGRSNIVGKPVAALLMQKGRWGDATVTVAHSRTKNLAEVCRRADILIAAIGKPNTILAEMVKPGAVIIDVGVNRIDDKSTPKGYRLVGDVDFEACREVAGWITPVPGGVGPMTIAMLLSNTVLAAEKSISL
ncbi:MAG: bifunctional methylenetetrahydrofolate dehydrogenase/methenyltetrahydrofolate cyclohydrolase FolD [Candidatus Zixiibacteriota bacterium]